MKKLLLALLLPLTVALFCFACKKGDAHAALPAAAKNYIDQKYPGAEVDDAEQEKLCDGKEAIAVEVEPSGGDEMELVFDLDGKLLFSETEIAISALPAAVTNAVSAQFPGYTIKEAERLDMADDSVRYEVELKKGSTLDVTFDSEGTEICREEDN